MTDDSQTGERAGGGTESELMAKQAASSEIAAGLRVCSIVVSESERDCHYRRSMGSGEGGESKRRKVESGSPSKLSLCSGSTKLTLRPEDAEKLSEYQLTSISPARTTPTTPEAPS